MSRLRAAVFDFGETLLSEERAWGVWADWIGATRQELFAAIGATVEGRYPHRHALELCSPGFDLRRAFAERAAAGVPRHEELYDLYPDAGAALARLRAAGVRVGIAGNQPAGAERSVAAGRGAAISSRPPRRGACPSPIRRSSRACWPSSTLPAAAVAYVGDRVDNDVLPAAAGGPVHGPSAPRALGRDPGGLAGGGDGRRLRARTSTKPSPRSSPRA